MLPSTGPESVHGSLRGSPSSVPEIGSIIRAERRTVRLASTPASAAAIVRLFFAAKRVGLICAVMTPSRRTLTAAQTMMIRIAVGIA